MNGLKKKRITGVPVMDPVRGTIGQPKPGAVATPYMAVKASMPAIRGQPVDRQTQLLARAQAAKAAGLPAHSGVGQAIKRLEAARAAGQTHTGLGQKLRRKLRMARHPDAKSVNWY